MFKWFKNKFIHRKFFYGETVKYEIVPEYDVYKNTKIYVIYNTMEMSYNRYFSLFGFVTIPLGTFKTLERSYTHESFPDIEKCRNRVNHLVSFYQERKKLIEETEKEKVEEYYV